MRERTYSLSTTRLLHIFSSSVPEEIQKLECFEDRSGRVMRWKGSVAIG